MADPPTPPHTPASSSKGKSNVNQGNVNNGNIRNNGGVVTGNVNGFNTIIATLNLTVDTATTLTDNIQNFTARVATVAERLRDVEDRIRATSQILSNIRDLLVRLAAKENITIDREFRAQEDGTNIGSRGPSNEGTTTGNASGEGTRGDIQPGQPPDGSARVPEQNVSNTNRFRSLADAFERATNRFKEINTKIQYATNDIEPMQRGRDKIELNDDARQKFSLTELHIDKMERDIESHKLELNLALTVFKTAIDDNRSEAIESKVLDLFKSLAERVLDEIVNINRGLWKTIRGPNGNHHTRSEHGHQQVYPDRRPFIFPDLHRLTSLYLGWTFTKGKPPYVHINTTSTQPSWRWATCSQMPLSTEELFLKVLAQTTKRAKLRRTIQDDYKDLLKTSVQRLLVDDLLRRENERLSQEHPSLELNLAGLSSKTRRIGFFSHETKSIEVILKTQWAPDLPRHAPMPPGGGGGQPPPPPSDFGPYGPGRPLGGGGEGGGGGGGGGSGPGYPPGGGSGHTSHGPRHGSGGHDNHSSHTRPPSKPQLPPGAHSRPHVTPSNSAPEIVPRDPRMYVVRKKIKGKAAASDSDSNRQVFVRDKRGKSKIHIESRRPTSSDADHIDGPSSSARPDHYIPQPAAGPYESIHTHKPTYPPRPAVETVYSTTASSYSHYSSDEEQIYDNQPPQPTSIHVQSRTMTLAEEKRLIDDIFAEWEEGVRGTQTTTTQDPHQQRKEDHTSSSQGPRIGPTRRIMMAVEHEAQKQDKMLQTIAESHRLEESYRHAREPHHRAPSHLYTREPRGKRHVNINLDGGFDSYGGFDMDRRDFGDERYRSFVQPELGEGPSRWYGAHGSRPERQDRERHYMYVGEAEPQYRQREYVYGGEVDPRVQVDPRVRVHRHGPGERRREHEHARMSYVEPRELVEEDEMSDSVSVMVVQRRESGRERPHVIVSRGPEWSGRERDSRRRRMAHREVR
ncbi:uncharacterized protein N7477_001879 [Penicillium maclennaniae]|uniref:uncharacterized protein n=1 Tax=Penicillium maclennaniae TaxID=1343394 RepID=UPI00253F775A|nr:uncharacterized protein N7477_001879 [Penicillium maclennaniae]KAJ5681939.1 hypothetical protein N7477_001879 [Penicillium maclennaniae]